VPDALLHFQAHSITALQCRTILPGDRGNNTLRDIKSKSTRVEMQPLSINKYNKKSMDCDARLAAQLCKQDDL